jgi:hypothetical protein
MSIYHGNRVDEPTPSLLGGQVAVGLTRYDLSGGPGGRPNGAVHPPPFMIHALLRWEVKFECDQNIVERSSKQGPMRCWEKQSNTTCWLVSQSIVRRGADRGRLISPANPRWGSFGRGTIRPTRARVHQRSNSRTGVLVVPAAVKSR